MRKEKLEELNRLMDKYKTISKTEEVQRGDSFITVHEAKYTLNNGAIISRDRIMKNHLNGSSCNVLPLTKEGNVILVVQPRVHVESGVGVEIPAGLCENSEDLLVTCKRELEEETGYTTSDDKFIKLVSCYQDEGCSSAISTFYLALDCEKVTEQHLDSDEYIDLFECTLDEAYELIDLGYIRGAFTILNLDKAKQYLEKMNK